MRLNGQCVNTYERGQRPEGAYENENGSKERVTY